jgi:hypothetical protein
MVESREEEKSLRQSKYATTTNGFLGNEWIGYGKIRSVKQEASTSLANKKQSCKRESSRGGGTSKPRGHCRLLVSCQL